MATSMVIRYGSYERDHKDRSSVIEAAGRSIVITASSARELCLPGRLISR